TPVEAGVCSPLLRTNVRCLALTRCLTPVGCQTPPDCACVRCAVAVWVTTSGRRGGGPGRTPWPGAGNPAAYRPVWSRYWRGRAIPARPADLVQIAARGWRNCDAVRADARARAGRRPTPACPAATAPRAGK